MSPVAQQGRYRILCGQERQGHAGGETPPIQRSLAVWVDHRDRHARMVKRSNQPSKAGTASCVDKTGTAKATRGVKPLLSNGHW
jgi:hypothetical protein